jgi:hypothetical protein
MSVTLDLIHHSIRLSNAVEHDFDIIAMRGDRGVDGAAVIYAVNRYPGERDVDLDQMFA